MDDCGSNLKMAELKLVDNSSEREYYDNLADLYSILIATEALERAYLRDSMYFVVLNL